MVASTGNVIKYCVQRRLCMVTLKLALFSTTRDEREMIVKGSSLMGIPVRYDVIYHV